MTSGTETQSEKPPGWTRVVAIAGGIGFLAPGVWAMVDPRSFFAALAAFEPYNQHFLQDIGAFQISRVRPGAI